jgi:GNAT superfamily N-acetyltransferase
MAESEFTAVAPLDIPVMLLARLAVDHRDQGKGLGKALLKDAILRTIQAAEIAGLKVLLVHAKDEAAADFYRKHGFEPVVDDPLKLFLPVAVVFRMTCVFIVVPVSVVHHDLLQLFSFFLGVLSGYFLSLTTRRSRL